MAGTTRTQVAFYRKDAEATSHDFRIISNSKEIGFGGFRLQALRLGEGPSCRSINAAKYLYLTQSAMAI